MSTTDDASAGSSIGVEPEPTDEHIELIDRRQAPSIDEAPAVPDTIDLRDRAEVASRGERPRRALPIEVSVIVPTLNEERALPALLDDLAAQSYPALEILVVDGGSEDGTRRVAGGRDDLPIRVLDNPARRVPQALNIGLAHCSGELVVRVDGHARINSTYIETIARHFLAAPDLGGVGGTKRAVAETTTGRVIAKVLSSRFGVGGSRYHYASEVETVDHIPFGAYRRDLLEELGGWDEAFSVNQDYELDYRIRQTGRRLLLDPAARIDWHSRESLGRLAHQYQRYGQGKALVVWRHPSSAKPRHLIPMLLVIGLAMSPLTALVVGRPWPLLVAPAYVVAVGAGAALVDGVGRREWPTAAAAIVAMQLSYGVGLVRGFAARLAGRTAPISSSQVGELSRPGS